MFYFLIDKLAKNEKWTALGKYMEPPIFFEKEIRDGFGGYCEYNLFSCDIYIKDKYIDDFGIQEHELCHARQFGRLLWVHSILSMVSSWYRLLIELEAYREQVKWYKYSHKSNYQWVVDSLFNKYNLKISKDKIQKYADYAFEDLLIS